MSSGGGDAAWTWAVVAGFAFVVLGGTWAGLELAGSVAGGGRPGLGLVDATVAGVALVRGDELAGKLTPGQVAVLPHRHVALAYVLASTVLVAAVVNACVAEVLDTVRPGGRRARAASRSSRWARRRDVGILRPTGRRRQGEGVVETSRLALGVLKGGAGRVLVFAEENSSTMVVGPARSGKTTGLAIPAILEWPGPVVAMSVKGDLREHTIGARSERGPVWTYDPTVPGSTPWTPLQPVRAQEAPRAQLEAANRVARRLVGNTGPSSRGDESMWRNGARGALVPLLLAASRREDGTMGDVLRWMDGLSGGSGGDDAHEAKAEARYEAESLAAELALEPELEQSALALATLVGRDVRIRDSILFTLSSCLEPYRDPAVTEAAAGEAFDPTAVLNGGTIYACAPMENQEALAGVFSLLIGEVITAAYRHAADLGGKLDQPLLVVIDEAANTAPIENLAQVAATCAGQGIQLVTIWQDTAQIASRYGADAKRTIQNNHGAKVLLSGISDVETLRDFSTLGGEETLISQSASRERGGGRWTTSASEIQRPLATPAELREIPRGEGIVYYRHLRPIRVRLRPWFDDHELRRRAERVTTPT
jgi:type IV secretion system protein VirD4